MNVLWGGGIGGETGGGRWWVMTIGTGSRSDDDGEPGDPEGSTHPAHAHSTAGRIHPGTSGLGSVTTISAS